MVDEKLKGEGTAVSEPVTATTTTTPTATPLDAKADVPPAESPSPPPSEAGPPPTAGPAVAKPLPELLFSFGEGFFRDHVGAILEEPTVALVELVANAYDAGARRVDLWIPAELEDDLVVSDDGTGMTEAEFKHRWTQFSYSRLKQQGEMVTFPPGGPKGVRRAFGRNGKGRHAAFCFGDTYVIETWRDGALTKSTVHLTNDPDRPFTIDPPLTAARAGHGTKVTVAVRRHLLEPEKVMAGVGSKFVSDPSFKVFVNNKEVQLTTLPGVARIEVDVPNIGKVMLSRVDGAAADRVTKLRGLAWWVNGRLVGEPSWEGLDGDGHYLDGRTAEAKRFTFIIEADVLKPKVKADWSGFRADAVVNAVRREVHDAVLRELETVLASRRRERKRDALQESRALLRELAPSAVQTVSTFVDKVIEACPTIGQKDLERLVRVLGTMEKARSAYELLGKLAQCSPTDIDTWNGLMAKWTADHASIVFNELDRRIRVIEQLEKLAPSENADELHDLQPVFEVGLWMFGPEYEAIDFRSNRTLATVVEGFLGGLKEGETLPASRRPDFVALPGRSIGLYGAADYDDDSGESAGLRKVLIVELKRGGFTLTQKEVDQARDYAVELRKSRHVQQTTKLHAYVLGAILEEGVEFTKHGEYVHVEPLTYDALIRRAKQRTFFLQAKLAAVVVKPPVDEDVEAILSAAVQMPLMAGTASGPQVEPPPTTAAPS